MIQHTRQAFAEIIYNGKIITQSIADSTGKFDYTDTADKSDTISLTIDDKADRWLLDWYPSTGDKIIAALLVTDWLFPGDARILNCGSFVLDDPTFSGPPTSVSLNAVSQPASESFTVTERTQTWERATVQQIAGQIAGRSGLLLQYDAESITVETKEQSKETDSAFLQKLCSEYGLCLKVYSNKLVVFDREMYKKKPAIATITRADVKQWNFNPTLAGTYTGGTITYTDPYSEEDVTFTIGGGSRMLSMNEKADNEADAEKKLKSAINNANHDMMKMTLTTMGNPSLVSTQTVNVVGFGRADGKYYINEVKHSLSSSGYECSYDLSKVELSF